jgi:hypothetical protein
VELGGKDAIVELLNRSLVYEPAGVSRVLLCVCLLVWVWGRGVDVRVDLGIDKVRGIVDMIVGMMKGDL